VAPTVFITQPPNVANFHANAASLPSAFFSFFSACEFRRPVKGLPHFFLLFGLWVSPVGAPSYSSASRFSSGFLQAWHRKRLWDSIPQVLTPGSLFHPSISSPPPPLFSSKPGFRLTTFFFFCPALFFFLPTCWQQQPQAKDFQARPLGAFFFLD